MSSEISYPDASNVPVPPECGSYINLLKWCVFVMNDEDPQRHFAASCLAWGLKTGKLTQKQARACDRMIERIKDLYFHVALDCQYEGNSVDHCVEPQNKVVH